MEITMEKVSLKICIGRVITPVPSMTGRIGTFHNRTNKPVKPRSSQRERRNGLFVAGKREGKGVTPDQG
jgi:hypothetical protein